MFECEKKKLSYRFFPVEYSKSPYNKNFSVAGAASETSTFGREALVDWNRGKKNFFINGEVLEQVLAQHKFDPNYRLTVKLQFNQKTGQNDELIDFTDAESLRYFIEQKLLYKINSPALKNYLSGEALNHFHQGGMLYAGSVTLINRLVKTQPNYGVFSPNQKLFMMATFEGIKIHEISRFTQLSYNPEGKELQFFTLAPDQKYFALAESLREFNASIPEELAIKIYYGQIHCPERKYQEFFYPKTFSEKFFSGIKNIFGIPSQLSKASQQLEQDEQSVADVQQFTVNKMSASSPR